MISYNYVGTDIALYIFFTDLVRNDDDILTHRVLRCAFREVGDSGETLQELERAIGAAIITAGEPPHLFQSGNEEKAKAVIVLVRKGLMKICRDIESGFNTPSDFVLS